MAKYMTNAFLALKVTFANELYDLSTALDIDYEVVREATAADARIGPSHLNVFEGGYRGYGGKCLLKDTRALLELSDRLRVSLRLMRTADRVNESLVSPQDEPPSIRALPVARNGRSGEAAADLEKRAA